MSLPKDKAWFPSKKHGYGYGFPTRWQGWLVLVIFFALVNAGLPFAETHPLDVGAYALVLTMLLGAVCAWKGEAPEWRWGSVGKKEKATEPGHEKARAGFRMAAALIAIAFLMGIIYAGIQIGDGNHHLHIWVLVLFGAIFFPEFLSIAIKGDGFLLLNTERIRKQRSGKPAAESDGQAD